MTLTEQERRLLDPYLRGLFSRVRERRLTRKDLEKRAEVVDFWAEQFWLEGGEGRNLSGKMGERAMALRNAAEMRRE